MGLRIALGFLLAANLSAGEPLHTYLGASIPNEPYPALDWDFRAQHGVFSNPSVSSIPFPELSTNDYIPSLWIVNEHISPRYRRLSEDTLYLQTVMLSAIGVLALMPSDVTNWNTKDLQEKSLLMRWNENVFDGPVWDKDDWTINYIGHPVAGAYYYTLARNEGMSMAESAAFSTLMSTFFWEYGYEAFAEVPSIQDLIITPLIGSFLGEGMHVLEGRLDRQGGLIWGSRSMGNVGYFFLDPLGRIADGIKILLENFGVHLHLTVAVRSYPRALGTPSLMFPAPLDPALRWEDPYYGFVITFF